MEDKAQEAEFQEQERNALHDIEQKSRPRPAANIDGKLEGNMKTFVLVRVQLGDLTKAFVGAGFTSGTVRGEDNDTEHSALRRTFNSTQKASRTAALCHSHTSVST